MTRAKSLALLGIPAAGALGGGASFLPFTDAFDTDGAMSSPWLNTGWSVSGGAAVAAVALGSELVTDWDMEAAGVAAWPTYGTPTTKEKSAADKYTGAQSIFIESSSANAGAYQIIPSVSVGDFTLCSIAIRSISGTCGLIDKTGTRYSPNLSLMSANTNWTVLQAVHRVISANPLYYLSGNVGAFAGYMDDVSFKKISLLSMLQLVDAGFANVTATVKATITANTQSGVALCFDSDGSPANGVVGYYDRVDNHAKLLKLVAGTWTAVIDAAATYISGAVVKVVQTGDTTFQLFYNGVQIGTDVTISDAAIISNTLHGLFSTYANSFDDFTLEASNG